MSTTLHGPGEGEAHAAGPARIVIKATGEETVSLEPGSFACIPPGTVHTFRNRSDAPVRFLNFNTPAGWEGYMRDLAEAARAEPLTPAVIGRIASRYDFQVA